MKKKCRNTNLKSQFKFFSKNKKYCNLLHSVFIFNLLFLSFKFLLFLSNALFVSSKSLMAQRKKVEKNEILKNKYEF
jgi:hypothetical protein